MSREVHLDFRREHRPPVWPGVVLFTAAFLAGIALAIQYQQLSAEVANVEAHVRMSAGAAQKKRPPPVRQSGDVQVATLEIKRATEIAAQLRLPWSALFQSIEASPVPDVALLSIESDNDKRKVKISAEGKNVDAMLAYLGFLEGLPTLKAVFLESHSVQQQDPQRPIRFVVGADWVVHDAAVVARGL